MAKQKDDTAPPPGDPVLKGWRVRCTLPRGIRRAGRFWPLGEHDIGPDELAPAQLDALRQDPAFTVEPIYG